MDVGIVGMCGGKKRRLGENIFSRLYVIILLSNCNH